MAGMDGKRFHSTKQGVSMEMLRFPGEPRESERAGAPDRNPPRQAFAQQGAPERDRRPRRGERELTAGQAGAETRLQHSSNQGVRCRGMTHRVDPRQGSQPQRQAARERSCQ